MTASGVARRSDVAEGPGGAGAGGAGGGAAQISSSVRYVLAALLLLVGVGDLAAIDLVFLPRYLSGAASAVSPRPPSPPAAATPTAEMPALPPSSPPLVDVPARPEPAQPPPVEAPVAAAAELSEFPHLLFARNTTWLSPEAKEILARLAAALVENPNRRVVLGGHTDNLGLEDHNRALSIERARRCGRWLEGRGIDPARIEIHGFGSTRPVASDDSPLAQARNRRVEIELR